MNAQGKPRIALVTGASRGIGKVIAQRLIDDGHTVVYGDRRQSELLVHVDESHPNAWSVRIDVGDRLSVREAIRAIEDRIGSPAILVNNAGIADEKAFEEITDEDWDRMMQVNLRGAFMVAQEALPSMRKEGWGRIVNITSIGGQWGGMRQVHYAAAKAGLISLTHSLAKLYSKDGITSNAVAPGLVATDMIRKEIASFSGKEKVAQIPIGRIAEPEEVAAAVAFLVSDDARYITGQTLNVNGGLLFS